MARDFPGFDGRGNCNVSGEQRGHRGGDVGDDPGQNDAVLTGFRLSNDALKPTKGVVLGVRASRHFVPRRTIFFESPFAA